MPGILDLPAVRRFTDDLTNRQSRCDNNEGMICSTLEERINHYVKLCDELLEYVGHWARAVFKGEIAFNSDVEHLLKQDAKLLLEGAKKCADSGRALEGRCYSLDDLNRLHRFIRSLEYQLAHWVSPRLAVGPAPRVKLPEATERQIEQRLGQLPPLPNDWLPTDPDQLVLFKQQQKV